MIFFSAFYTLLLITIAIVLLYKDVYRPSVIFIGAAILLIFGNVISVDEFLNGLANKQIITIFLLIVLTSGIQKNIGSDFFYQLFHKGLSPQKFRFRLMVFVGGLSAILNNTPIVAFMVPYVKEWATSNKFATSKFLIPLSFATMLGGTITVIGTSTNLVLNGLIGQYGFPLLGYQDFLFLGLIVSVIGIIYLTLFSNSLLPDRRENKDNVFQHLNEYIVETFISDYSPVVGKSVKDAGLRKLKEIYLVEISRNGKAITPVAPEEKLYNGDRLFFTGNSKAILSLIKEENGLKILEEPHIENNGFQHLIEAVVPSSSSLIGEKLKNTDFRNRFQGSIISIYRRGEQLKGNIGDTKIQAGDLLLMVSGGQSSSDNNKDLIIVTRQGEIIKPKKKQLYAPFGAILLLIPGIIGWLDLFMAAILGIFLLFLFKNINISIIRRAIDVELLAILVGSLAIGVGLKNSGAASLLVEGILSITSPYGIMVSISLLFIFTLLLTSLITNAAAVSIMFPVALEMGTHMEFPMTPFFVAIAFAASGDFMTPIGYQTNLMVMGPGNYKFKDYFKLGFPLTLIYTLISLLFINFYYLTR